jgi:adenosylmethionine-8-amino-7-oxononanoate aminotransferase
MINPKILYPFSVNNDPSGTKIITRYNKFSYTDNDKDILDLSLGNCGSFMLGFDRLDIIEFVSNKMKDNPFVSGEFMTTNDTVLELSERLYHLSGGYRSMFSLSGSDAVEGAIKLAAIKNPDRKKIVGIKNSYHGSTFLSSSIGDIGYMTKNWGRHSNCVAVNCDIKNIEEELSDAMCFVIESCSWNNGLTVHSQDFWTELRQICNHKGVVLIIDDIAMCGGKTGKFFGFDSSAEPDIVCVGKSFSGGYFPLSACLVHDNFFQTINDQFLAHGFTYSFSLSGIYSTLKYISLIEEEGHFDNFNSTLDQARVVFESLKYRDCIIEYKNYGLVFELITRETEEKIFYQNGINKGLWNSHNNRLLVIIPLNADREYFDKLNLRLQNALHRL